MILKHACMHHWLYFSGNKQKMCKNKFFELIKIGIEKKFLKFEENEKLTFEKSIWVKKWKFNSF